VRLINPYKDIDWTKQHKANLHTHTLQTTIDGVIYGSDGDLTQQQVIDSYHNKNYKILAITDHDNYYNLNTLSKVTTHPWELFNRSPNELGILAVEGKELSKGNHRNSLFCDLGTFPDGSLAADIYGSINEIRNRDGLCIINHPGEYSETEEYYFDLFTTFRNTLIGFEVLNKGNIYPNDRNMWDKINALTIPAGKVVYGYSNDDMHRASQLFRNYQFILSPSIEEEEVKTAMRNGATYFCYEPGGSGNALAPRIMNIVVDEVNENISITTDGETIKWVTEETVEVGSGDTFNYSNLNKSFVRAVISNDHGITYTQPFAFTNAPEEPDEPDESETMKPVNIIGTKMWHYGTWIDVEVRGFVKDKWRRVEANRY
jgi:hypothetical protein